MNNSFNVGALILSIIVGIIVVVGFAYITGDLYAAPLFPVTALLAGFIITGFTIGIISKGVTLIEPGLGSILVAAISFLIIPGFGLSGFMDLTDSDWILILLNAVILTFVGAWLGEMFQHGLIDHSKDAFPHLYWGWILAGTVFGVTLTIVLVNLLTLIFGANPSMFYIPYFISLLFVGIVIGWYSPGITIKEAGIAGFLIMTFEFDIVKLTLFTDYIGLDFLIGGLALGFVVTLIGGWLGERLQKVRERKASSND